MSLAVYIQLGLRSPKSTLTRLYFGFHCEKLVRGLCDILVRVESFIFLVDFVIIDSKADFKVLTILERPFLTIWKTLVDIEIGYLKFQLNYEEVTFIVCETISVIDTGNENAWLASIDGRLGV